MQGYCSNNPRIFCRKVSINLQIPKKRSHCYWSQVPTPGCDSYRYSCQDLRFLPRPGQHPPTGHDTKTAIAPRWLYWPPALSLIPPNRDVAVNINFRLSGYVEYYTDDGGFYSNSMQGGQCNISRSGIVGSDVKGTLYINVLCVARNSGTWPVYLTSSIPGLTVQAIGEIRAQ